MVATSHPLAVQAALDVLDEGGTAADAAVCAAAVLTVVDPRSTGIGGDLFAHFWPAGASEPVALSASGPAPAALTVDALRAAGFDEMPSSGPWAVTVPGSVAGWGVLLERFGKLGLERALEPAIRLAEDGFHVARFVAQEWATCAAKLAGNAAAAQTYLPHGRVPQEGERFANPDLAGSLRSIATNGPDSFYAGEMAERTGATVAELGGPLRPGDLSAWRGPEWVTPISADYRGVRVYQIPPPGQGLITLQALLIYAELDPADPIDAEHVGIEANKLAFADAQAFIADPQFARVPVDVLLSPDYVRRRAGLVAPRQAIHARAGTPTDTVYAAVADGEGGACSIIQSLYEGFGSGVVVAGTGITLQNRGAGFVLDDTHPNRPEPGKRPYHTIIPAILGDSDGFLGCLGVVGGFMQPQGQFQILRSLLDRGLDPQAALDAPRFRVMAGRQVAFEDAYDRSVLAQLADRGHEITKLARFEAGGAQLVLHRDGRFLGASDPRKDGTAAGR